MLKRWLQRFQSEHSVANPQGQNAADATIYQQLGGESAMRRMAKRFYEIMDTDPSVSELRAIHPESLQGSEHKFFEFLSGWFDGPQLYVEKYGHPMLRARHLPFAIDTRMRDQWLSCIYTTLDEQVPAGPLHNEIRQRFTRLAHHMINQSTPS